MSYITKVVLRSASNDYVNWANLRFRRYGASTLCQITGPTTTCDGVTATVSPWSQGTNFDPFQGTDNYSGVQAPIDITFANPVYAATVTAVDPDYAGNQMVAYDAAGNVLQTVSFTGDNQPGVFSTDTKTVSSSAGIARIQLIADPNDYTAFQGLTVTPGV